MTKIGLDLQCRVPGKRCESYHSQEEREVRARLTKVDGAKDGGDVSDRRIFKRRT